MADAAASSATTRRNRLLGLLGAVVVIGIVAWGLYYVLVSSHQVETDNAYVGADTALVTPLIAGPVAKVLVNETQVVKAGDPLVVLDDSDAKIAVAEAEAALGQAQRRVKGYYASDSALAGQVAARQADISRSDAAISSAQSDLDRAKIDLDRRKALASSGAVSGDELSTAENRYATAQQALIEMRAGKTQAEASRLAAVGSRDVNSALITGPADKNPEVAAAEARLAAAQLMLTRTVLRAPMSGIVSKKAVEIGQQVQIGAPLMSIVPVDAAYVDANFKEVQLEKVRAGQAVTLTADLYGKKIKFHGKVRGLSGGTGSAFSLIPAQNATGNWIKVVQRLPVRIDLDPADLKAHPLRIGLSMKAEIDTDQS
jgi:membrane fusion protein (multidrug efflux system)